MAFASSVSASAPGSLMLLGEHAVLHGRRALVCAVDRRITVTLTPRRDRAVNLASTLGRLATDLDHLPPDGPFRFIAAVLRMAHLASGADLVVASEFSDQVGLGSSAAVTVATVAAVNALAGAMPSAEELHGQALAAIRSVQGVGSGADAAASVLGGIVAYRAAPRELRRLPRTHPIAVVYSGSKTPTVEVIAQVDRRRRGAPGRFDALFDEIDRSVGEAVAAVAQADWVRLGAILDANQRHMDHLGVSTVALDEIVAGLRACPGVLGAKISGSGLGDCAVGLGALSEWTLPYEVLDVKMAEEGVRME